MDDVCLVVESDGDLFSAGIPRAAYELIQTLSHIRFSVVTIAHRPYAITSLVTKLPENVTELVNISLEENYIFPVRCPLRKKRAEFWKQLESMYAASLPDKLRYVESVMLSLVSDELRVQSYADIVKAPEFWGILRSQYERYCSDVSFLDYVWIFRQTQLPYFQLMQMELPRAKIYHVFSSRYAGCAGLMEKIRNRSHLIIDLREDYFIDENNPILHPNRGHRQAMATGVTGVSLDAFVKTYNATLKTIQFLSGFYADAIIVKNRLSQAALLGRDLEYKFLVIPSGMEEVQPPEKKIPAKESISVGLVADIIPGSDVKSFIRAARLLLNENHRFRFSVLGMENIDTDAVEECVFLRNQLGLELDLSIYYDRDDVRFLRDLDIVVFAGGKPEERKPVLCRAIAGGRPIVATRTGIFPDVIEGNTSEDRALGECGILIESGSPREFARAIMAIAADPKLAREMGKTAVRRFEQFYSHSIHLNSYVSLYNNYF